MQAAWKTEKDSGNERHIQSAHYSTGQKRNLWIVWKKKQNKTGNNSRVTYEYIESV